MLKYLVLGTIQGIFEWVPLSSEGLVALASQALKWEGNPVDLALFLHLGTLLAVLIYFYKDWQEIITLKNKPLIRFLTIATIISLAIGYPLYKTIRNVAIGNGLLSIMGFGLLATAFFHKNKKTFQINEDKLAIISGFLQGLAVIPGLSRSGATIFGLSLTKDSPAEILKLSYLMSAPVVLASSVFLFLNNSILIINAWPALLTSFVIGILSLHFLLKLSRKINFFWFALVFSLFCFLAAGLEFFLL